MRDTIEWEKRERMAESESEPWQTRSTRQDVLMRRGCRVVRSVVFNLIHAKLILKVN